MPFLGCVGAPTITSLEWMGIAIYKYAPIGVLS